MPKHQLRSAGTRARLAGLGIAVMALALAGCSGLGPGDAHTPTFTVDPNMKARADALMAEPPLVLTTFTVIADMAREVGGDDVRVESITSVGAEIHGYEPTPGDLQRAVGADLVLDNGLGLEAWFEGFLSNVDAPRVTVSDGIDVIDISGEGTTGQANPHAWMSPTQAHTYVDNIVTALSELEPARASAFEKRGADYQQRISEVAGELDATLATVPQEQRVLVTCEGAFSYLARDAGLEEVYLWPVNAEQDATGKSIAAAIDIVRDRNVPAVFCESTVSERAMRQVEQATDAEWGGTLYVDSLSTADGPVPSYLELLRHDVHTIANGLTGASS